MQMRIYTHTHTQNISFFLLVGPAGPNPNITDNEAANSAAAQHDGDRIELEVDGDAWSVTESQCWPEPSKNHG